VGRECGSVGASAEIHKTLTTETYMDRIREDCLSGVRGGVNGTPTFFINGKRHDGPYDSDSLLAAITSATA
jgi:protein-disulfide isomerase